MTSKPAKISVSRSEGLLRITWEDGRHSSYDLTGLRSACPCAECRGGHENMGQPGSPALLDSALRPGQSDELENVALVGNYALQAIWKDGHDYGIYSWAYLKELCPPQASHPKEESGE